MSKQNLDREEETRLVVLAKDGCRKALERLIEAHYGNMQYVALKMTRDPVRSQDVTQQACLQVVQKLHQFSGEVRLGAWLARIVVNTAFLQHRRERRHVLNTDVYEVDLPSDESDPEGLTGDRQILGKTNAVLGELREVDREIFSRRFIDGLTLEQISSETGLSVAALKSRVHRARQRLKDAAESWGIELDAAA